MFRPAKGEGLATGAGSAVRGGRLVVRALATLVALACVSGVAPDFAGAETYPVSNTAQFAEAVAKANANSGPNTIKLAAGGYQPESVVRLTNTSGTLTIEGPTTEAATFNGGGVEPFPSEIFNIKSGVSVIFKDVQATTAATEAINDFGKVEVESSTVGGNSGPGILVEKEATATIRNSTISDGLQQGVIVEGTASLFNSTVAFNSGGGIDNKGTLNLTNTIVADNLGGDCEGKANTTDHSLDSDGSCGVEQSKVNPKLGPLAFNGGPTQTHALETGSPAIDAGDKAACPTVDQRGSTRPDVPGTACDVGAYEFQEVITRPSVETAPASSITQTTATLNGKVNPNGNEVSSCTFEYGTTLPSGKTAPCSPAPGAGSSAVSVSAAITGLSANTTYHFKLTATNSGGPSEAEGEFKTAAEVSGEPAAELRKLLAEVEAAPIPHNLRATLSHLLEEALARLAEQHAAPGSRDARVSREARLSSGGCVCRELQRFIAVIAHDQHRRVPKIPVELATAWTLAAGEIAASLGCKSDHQSSERIRPRVVRLR